MSGARGRTLAIVQARSTSSRLPGKVLRPLAGAPMILRQLERMRRATTLDGIVVATSDDPTDDALTSLLETHGIDVGRGALDDVLDRYVRVLDARDCDVVVRITADCPLISPAVIDLVVNHFHAGEADYVSNTMHPTFPDGLDVEVMTSRALRSVGTTASDPHEREHVTLGIYRRPEVFTIENVIDPIGRDNSNLRWTVDTEDDFLFVSDVYAQVDGMEFEYDDVLRLLEQRPDLARTDKDAPRNAALSGLDTGVMERSDPT